MPKTELLLTAVLYCAAFLLPGVEGTVRTELLNIRTGPGYGYWIVGQLRKGEKVQILSDPRAVWCRIAMPENVSVWIAASMLDAEGVPLPGAVVRSGPGAAYERLGDALPEKVEVRERVRSGKWLRIRPQTGLDVYVCRTYLAVAGASPAADGPAGNRTAASDDAGSESRMDAEGIVERLEMPDHPGLYALAVRVNGERWIAAYLTGAGRLDLRLWENREVRVSGKCRWVNAWRRPLITVEQIVPAWRK